MSQTPSPTSQTPPQIGKAPASQRRQAIGLLLTGRPRGEDPAVGRFLRYAAEQSLSLDGLWIAQRDGRLEGVALIVPCAGRTAMLFLSEVADDPAVPVHAQLAAAASDAQSHSHVHLVQALLEVPQTRAIQAMRHAGYQELATLTYMQHHLDRQTPAPTPWPAGYTVQTWSPRTRPTFAAAIRASYEQTLDCPGLLGLRKIEDIIDGHMSIGVFDAAMWTCLLHNDQPVGALLLNPLAGGEAVELVYLGLAPSVRSQGMGRHLLRYGLHLCASRGARSMHLAVDESNIPAVRLYRAFDFQATTRKVAMIRPTR